MYSILFVVCRWISSLALFMMVCICLVWLWMKHCQKKETFTMELKSLDACGIVTFMVRLTSHTIKYQLKQEVHGRSCGTYFPSYASMYIKASNNYELIIIWFSGSCSYIIMLVLALCDSYLTSLHICHVGIIDGRKLKNT